MKKLLLIIGIFLFALIDVFGQQEAVYTHYTFNHLGVNPAYAGSRELISATALHRSQWVGFEGAPVTQTFTIHSPTFYKSLAVGLSVINDKIGPVSRTSFYGDLAFRLKLNKKTRLSFGVKGGGSIASLNLGTVEIESTDNRFTSTRQNFLPNVGAGIYLDNKKYYVGFSSPNILQNELNDEELEQRHFYFIGGYIAKLSKTIKLKPSTYVQLTAGAPLVADLTLIAIFKDKFELGIMGRSGDALGLLVGYNFNPRLRAGYSFDWSFTNATGRYNAGSHEIMLRYEFNGSNKKMVHSPRYF